MSAFLMPSLGADMEAGTLVEQLVSPGNAVRHGDIIAAVETQKGVIEIEAFEDGILEEWLVELGTEVPVGTPLANIKVGDVSPTQDLSECQNDPEPGKPEAPQPQDPAPSPSQPEDPAPCDPSPQPPGPEVPTPEFPEPEIHRARVAARSSTKEGKPRLLITPAARRLAAQSGIDLHSITAKSHGIPIGRADIAAMAKPIRPEPLNEMRSAIAAAMSRSKREIPHYYLSHQADLTNTDAFLTKTNKNRPPQNRLLLGVLYLRAVSLAVKKVPEMNGHFQEDRFQASQDINVGLAISLRGGGLVAPAILKTDTMQLDDLMKEMSDLVARVRAGRFRSRELSDATITLTSLGDRAVSQIFGVIYPPQVAIVGIGTPVLRPWIHEGKIVPRLIADITLSADHRVSDGRRGALFLKTIAESLFTPETL